MSATTVPDDTARYGIAFASTGDPEIDAMQAVHLALRVLPVGVQRRVAGWAFDRYGTEQS